MMWQSVNHSYILIWFCFCVVLQGHAITVSSTAGSDNTTCCFSSLPCSSLQYALSCISNRTTGTPAIIVIDGASSLTGRTEFVVPTGYNVTITGKPAVLTELKCGTPKSTLVIKGNRDSFITFNNILMHDCGPNVPSAILIEGPLNAEFNNCTFINNMCAGLNVRDANLVIKNSRFRNNIANQTNSFEVDFQFGNTSLGGSLGIMFHKGIGNKVEILSSEFSLSKTFVNEDPNAVSHDTGQKRLLSNYYASGGGLSVINTFDSQSNTVLIKNCIFNQNQGTYGGGLFLTFVHNSTGNRIIIENSTISNNFVSLTGGGLLISSWDQAYNNSIYIVNCDIYSNDAMGGGAMKVIYNSINRFNENLGGSLDFQMNNSRVFNNKAMSGSALRMLSNIPPGRIQTVLPKVTDCIISGHRPARASKEYPGAVLSTKLGIEFYGTNHLMNNTQGSAIHISAGTIHVKGTLIFHKNVGLQGGAVYLADTSKITLHPGSFLNVSQNHANFRGGGFYVEATTLREVTYPYNPGCFLQYSVAKTPPSKWEVCMKNFHYVKNLLK